MNEVDRHDLEALKDLMEAKFEGVENTLEGMKEALHVAASERSRKDIELNEVRLRFVDRITFDKFKESQAEALSTALNALSERLKPLDDFRSKAIGYLALTALISGGLGALIAKAFGG